MIPVIYSLKTALVKPGRVSQPIFWKVLPIRKSDMKAMAPTDMASRIKLPNVSSTIALFLLMIHLPDVTKNV